MDFSGYSWKMNHRAQDWKQGDKIECHCNSVGEGWWWGRRSYNEGAEKSWDSGYCLKVKKIGLDDGINTKNMWETS